MDEEHRRQEILKAEEAVRQLAEELARARQSRIEADDLTRGLAGVRATLEQTKQCLERAVEALRQTADNAHSALGDARTQLGSAEEQVARAAGGLREAVRHLDGFTPALGKLVGEAEESLSKGLGALGRWVRVSLVLSALAFVSSLACLLLLVRHGALCR